MQGGAGAQHGSIAKKLLTPCILLPKDRKCAGDGVCFDVSEHSGHYYLPEVCPHMCVLVRCKLYDFCGGSMPAWFGKRFSGHCVMCTVTGMNKQRVRSTLVPCSVCHRRRSTEISFPTGCGHYFCCECTRRIMCEDTTSYHLSPVPFGGPPGPQGCQNPVRGVQCTCADHAQLIEQWGASSGGEHKEWCRAEKTSIKRAAYGPCYGCRKCPLCGSQVTPLLQRSKTMPTVQRVKYNRTGCL